MSDSTRDLFSAALILSVVAFPLAKLVYYGSEVAGLL